MEICSRSTLGISSGTTLWISSGTGWTGTFDTTSGNSSGTILWISSGTGEEEPLALIIPGLLQGLVWKLV